MRGFRSSWVAVSKGAVWVSNTSSGTVTRINPKKRKVVKVVRVGTGPVNLDVVGRDVWVPNDQSDTLSRISIARNRVVETLRTADNPAVVAPAAGAVWATMHDAGEVWRISRG
jgi:YVTN family beta-propeller protein